MCGIAGAVAVDGVLDPALAPAVRLMTDRLAHRGPDGEGHFVDAHAALGHRRLIIIDHATGQQPMSNEDGTCLVVFNGEIYNYRALRRHLEARGHRFRTASDTEVIVHGWEEFGAGLPAELHGMFALAVYDARRRELLLARDRLGKKPLFYMEHRGAVVFASEASAFAALPGWAGELDTAALEPYFSLGYVPAPRTFYRGVSQLQPAHLLHVRPGRSTTARYWDVVEFGTDTRPEPLVLDELSALLTSSVSDRLQADVPLGSFLSGGLDSAVVTMYAGELRKGIRTTTIAFDEAAHDESRLASATAARLGTDHRTVHASLDAELTCDLALRKLDQPLADASVIPTFRLAEAARQQVTMALSGDGGDEVFGGYDFRYTPHAYEAWARAHLPLGARRLARTLGRFWPRWRGLPRPLRLGRVLENIGRDAEAAYYVDLCFSKPWHTATLLGRSPRDFRNSASYEQIVAPYRRCSSESAVARAQYADLLGYLPNDVLTKVDRMTMAHGLEVRNPLLDHRIVEFAFRVPTPALLRCGHPKHLLRSLGARWLPPAVVRGTKHGFTAPVATWFRDAMGQRLEAEALAPDSELRGLIDVPVLTRTLREHQSGRANHSHTLWASWVLQRWLREQRKHTADVGT